MDISQLSPEEIQQILSISSFPEEQDLLKQQLAQAESLRVGTPRGTQAGRVYVAANPLEHIGAFMQNRNAQKQQNAVMDQQRKLIEQLRKGRMAYGNAVGNPGGMMPAGPQGNGVTTYPVP